MGKGLDFAAMVQATTKGPRPPLGARYLEPSSPQLGSDEGYGVLCPHLHHDGNRERRSQGNMEI